MQMIWLLHFVLLEPNQNLYPSLFYGLIQLCFGITRGRELNGELCAQRFHKLIYLHLFTDCFIKISPQSSGQPQNCK